MNQAVFPTFVVVFREALEASLIVGILLTALSRLGARRYFSHVILSALAAIVLSFAVGAWLGSLADSAQDRLGKIIEGSISLAACAVLTYMFFWMEKRSRGLKSGLETRAETALTARDDWAMMSLAFFAVLREGAETVLFLKAVAIQSGGSASAIGGFAGLALALSIAAFVFLGGRRLPLKTLFRATGVFILMMAAGLLAYGVHELEEAGWIPQFIYPLYNINPYLNEKAGIGSFLKALFGYNGNPSLTEVAAYWTYWTMITLSFFGSRGSGSARSR